MNHSSFKVLVFFILLIPFKHQAQTVIPYPQTQQNVTNKYDETKISSLRFIYASNAELNQDIKIFNEYLSKISCKPLEVKVSTYDVVHLQLDPKLKDEEYSIQHKANQSIEIRGGKHGVFYGLMTLVQLIYEHSLHQEIGIPTVHDYPAYAWRGMHLDVSRHFFPVDFIKKYIDILALHKLNTFHWHLTDDQGWRIEIKKYPLLTSIGSKRNETMLDKNFNPYIGDGKPVEGFFTQDQVKEVVQYASLRHINVVPEIEMPGHALAALSAYPEFSCNKTPLSPLTKWGVSDDVYCVNENTFKFLQNILDEVMQLFPSKYIHIGRDEVPKVRWKKCSTCQSTMKKYALKNEDELQSYFIKRMDAYVVSKGRNIIGWDEILDGGLAPNAAVMSWRGEQGGIDAAKQKHKVVMTPGSHCYFDHYQGNKSTEPLAIGGFTPVEKVYEYNPTPAVLNNEEKTYILGAQANIWTEYIATNDHVEYMALPRLCALAEVLWTGSKKPGFDNFKLRLREHFSFLDKLNYHYSNAIFDVTSVSKIKNDKVEITFNSTFVNENSSIHYYFHNNDPEILMQRCKPGNTIVIDSTSEISAQYYENAKAFGHLLKEKYLVHKAIGRTVTSTIEPSKYYNEGGLTKLVDAKAGYIPRNSAEWLGWSGQNPELTIDLEKEMSVSKLNIYTLQEELNWIYLPQQIQISWSVDGVNYNNPQQINSESIRQEYEKQKFITLSIPSTNMRYLKIGFTCAPKITKGKPGEGEDAWLFLSELEVE